MIKLIHLLVINGKYSYIYDAYPNFLNKKNNILIFLNFVPLRSHNTSSYKCNINPGGNEKLRR